MERTMAKEGFGFKVGDVVMLVSGGPCMAVVDTDGAGLHCAWYSIDNHLQAATFPAEALVKQDIFEK